MRTVGAFLILLAFVFPLLHVEGWAMSTLDFGPATRFDGAAVAWSEREPAERAAFSAPGVVSVESPIDVRSSAFV